MFRSRSSSLCLSHIILKTTCLLKRTLRRYANIVVLSGVAVATVLAPLTALDLKMTFVIDDQGVLIARAYIDGWS